MSVPLVLFDSNQYDIPGVATVVISGVTDVSFV
jgi:hypothetical protein